METTISDPKWNRSPPPSPRQHWGDSIHTMHCTTPTPKRPPPAAFDDLDGEAPDATRGSLRAHTAINIAPGSNAGPC